MLRLCSDKSSNSASVDDILKLAGFRHNRRTLHSTRNAPYSDYFKVTTVLSENEGEVGVWEQESQLIPFFNVSFTEALIWVLQEIPICLEAALVPYTICQQPRKRSYPHSAFSSAYLFAIAP